MKLLSGNTKWLILPLLAVIIVSSLTTGLTGAYFHDAELSQDNSIGAWVSTQWTQTSQADFNNGVLDNTAAAATGEVSLAAVAGVSLISADSSEVSTTSTSFQLMKTLSFTKSGLTYDEIRIESNLRGNNNSVAYSSIRIDGTEVASHQTSATSYQTYQDIIDTSGLSDGPHIVELYLQSNHQNKAAMNVQFAVYLTHLYAASGTIASQVLDTAMTGARWDALFWDETLGTGMDITFEVRASDTSFLQTDTSPAWTSVGSDSPVLTVPVSGRYQQWRATLTTPDTGVTPLLGEVRVYYTGPTIEITAIDTIGGMVQVGEMLTAGALTPSGATATYQWQRSSSVNGTYQPISGASSGTYTLASSDYGYYVRVVATGTGNYSGTVTSAAVGPVAAGSITAIGAITGITQVDETLTAGGLTPSGATAAYQWQRCGTVDGTYEDITGATAGTYTLTTEDYAYFIKVVVTGTGTYTGTVTSTAVGPVTATSIPITAIGTIVGTVQVSETLTAGDLTPSGATATYQWQRCATVDGTYEDISGATASTYPLSADDYEYYIKVVATGTGSYTGTVTSAAAGPAGEGVITAIGHIVGTVTVGNTLTAGDLTPLGATATYQWQYSDDTVGTTFYDIEGATSNTYEIANGEYTDRYLRVVATGTGAYTGTVSATTLSRVSSSSTPLTAIGAISGTTQVGQTLTVGSLTPTGATATYQWQRCDTIDGTYADITGATSSTYTLTASDLTCYIKVVASGSGSYTGTVTSEATGPVTAGVITAIGPVSGTAVVGETLTAGTLTPSGATATYQWQRAATAGGTYADITGATSGTYILAAGDNGYYIKVVATGTGGYTGTATSAATGPVTTSSTPLTAIGAISGTAQVGETLAAGALTPSGATATYQWQRCSTENGTYTNISGATSSAYTLTADDYEYYFKVVATGSGSYSGTVASAATGPVAAGTITAIGPISGTVTVGSTLTAGDLTPLGATATYRWQVSDDSMGTNFEDIPAAIYNTYTIANGAYTDRYIRVVATGTGAYTGEVFATTLTRVSSSSTPLTAIGAIGGTAQVGETLTAGTLTPSGATATYQWQRCSTVNGTYANIVGATSSTYTLIASDYTCYIKVIATGSGSYTGSVTSDAIGPVAAGTVTAIGAVNGSTVVDETLTAGTLTPAGATVTYQWQRATSVGGTYTDISGATSNSYTLTNDDGGYYIRIVATGTGSYTGTVTSAATGPVTGSSTPITAIGSIGGVARVGETLTAGSLTPSGATATYQWQRCSTVDGTYATISGATSGTYTLTSSDYGYYIKVVATGSGSYSGTVTSDAIGPVAAATLTGIGPISGTTAVGETLTAGAVTPTGATVSYKWQVSASGDDTTFTDIPGATNPSYYIVNGEYTYRYLRVVATGTGAYTGEVYATTLTRVTSSSTPITAIGTTSGTAQVGQTLTAGALTPSGATATYQWQRAATSDGTYANISGATSSTYTLTSADYGYYIKVVATGAGTYSGTVTSAATGPVTAGVVTAIGPISGTAAVGETLTAGTITPSSATVTYQWQRCATVDGTYEDISGATSNIYSLQAADDTYYIKVTVTGTGSYTGTVTSAATGPVAGSSTPITAIGAIGGTAQVGLTLTAGDLTPSGATATYQWQRCTASDGTYSTISGATSGTYTLTASDYGYYIRVVATGSGSYSGTVTSTAAGPVAQGVVTAIGAISGDALVGQTLTAGNVTPDGATVTYQWQYSYDDSTYTDISGATSSTYYIQNGQYNWAYLRVVVTGTGAYTGTVASEHTDTRVGGQP